MPQRWRRHATQGNLLVLSVLLSLTLTNISVVDLHQWWAIYMIIPYVAVMTILVTVNQLMCSLALPNLFRYL